MRSFHSSLRSENGFTLIELSVVLVVIGLIIGSVLVGATILQNARVTSTYNAMQAIQSAVATYNQNYDALPGDDVNAETRFPSNGVNTRGGGNGVIGSAALAQTFTISLGIEGDGPGESANVWQHLRAAGLVKGQGSQSNPPSNAFGGVIGIQNGAFTTSGISLGTNVLCASGIPGGAARVIDQRLDDGNALTGIVRGGPSITGPASDYVDGSNSIICMSL